MPILLHVIICGKKIFRTYRWTVTKIQVAACMQLVSGEFNSWEVFFGFILILFPRSTKVADCHQYSSQEIPLFPLVDRFVKSDNLLTGLYKHY